MKILSRHMLQTETSLKQNNHIYQQIKSGFVSLESGMTREETQRQLDTCVIKDGHKAAECLGEKIKDLSGMSKDQHEAVMDMLGQLQKQFKKFTSSTVRTREMPNLNAGSSGNLSEEQDKKQRQRR